MLISASKDMLLAVVTMALHSLVLDPVGMACCFQTKGYRTLLTIITHEQMMVPIPSTFLGKASVAKEVLKTAPQVVKVMAPPQVSVCQAVLFCSDLPVKVSSPFNPVKVGLLKIKGLTSDHLNQRCFGLVKASQWHSGLPHKDLSSQHFQSHGPSSMGSQDR